MDSAERQLSIIVPAYKEAPNLRPLCESVFAATRNAGITAEMIIVDDASNDGSEGIVEALSGRYDIRILVRHDERGLSSAVVRGFAEARYDVLMVMDADLSHPPDKVPDVAAKVFSGEAEFALGSRNVSGGETKNWPWRRWLNSWLATLPARPLTPVRDPMAGFFCLRRDTWQRADKLNPIGYKIGLELMVKCRCRRFAEVPIVFQDRLYGASKLTLWQRLLYVRQLWGLYWYRCPAAVVGALLLVPAVALLLLWS